MKAFVRLVFVFTLALISLLSPSASTGIARKASDDASGQTKQQPVTASANAVRELDEGRTLLRRGRTAEALIRLEAALKMFRQAGNRSGEAAAHDLLGELYELQGQYEVALEHYRAAHKIFVEAAALVDSARDAASSAASRIPLGMASSATRLVINFDAYHANLMLSKIGQMLYRQGRINDARVVFSEMRVERPDPGLLGNPKKGLGRMLGGLSGLGSARPTIDAPTDALSAARSIKERFEIYHRTIIYATYEIGLGRIAYHEKNVDGARMHFQNALEATKGELPFIGDLGQSRRFRAAARTGLADVALMQERYPDAVKLYQEAAKGAEKDKRLDLMWPAQRGIGRGRWLQAANERDAKKAERIRQESLAAYREALKTIEAIRQGSIRADEARTTFLATTKEVFDEATAALAETALMSGANGAPLEGRALEYAIQAFRATEQGRARSLLDLLSESGGQITEGVPPELLERKRENLDLQNEIASQLTGVNVSNEAPTKSVEDLERELDRLQTEFDAIENQIRAASPRYAALTAAQPVSLAEVQRDLLDEGTALLEYMLGEDASYLWVVVKDKAALYRLPARNVISKQVAEVRDQIVPVSLRRSLVEVGATGAARIASTTPPTTAGNAQSFAAASHSLYKTIFEPAAGLVGARRIVVAADGALSYIPFEALIASTATGADYSSLSYLIKSNEIVYTPSASVVAAIRKNATASDNQSGSILLVADPVFDPNDPRTRAAKPASAGMANLADNTRGLTLKSAVADVSNSTAKPSESFKLARLAGTRAEAEQVAATARTAGLKPDLWLDFEASEENASGRDLSGYRFIHFATHGLLNTERPQFTGLVLTLVGNRERDGFLRTDEVFNLRLGRPLIILSACETGLGRERRGEGIIGLTRAFMYAGAPTVAVTLWSVADRPTAELMSDFYKRLLAKERPSSAPSALREARLQMIAGKKYAAPFYWSPFVLAGEWR